MSDLSLAETVDASVQLLLASSPRDSVSTISPGLGLSNMDIRIVISLAFASIR